MMGGGHGSRNLSGRRAAAAAPVGWNGRTGSLLHLLLELNGQRRRCRHVGRRHSLVNAFVEDDDPAGHVEKLSFQLPGRRPVAQFRFGRPQFHPASATLVLRGQQRRFHYVARLHFVYRLVDNHKSQNELTLIIYVYLY